MMFENHDDLERPNKRGARRRQAGGFGDWLRKHRNALGLTQRQVASQAGVSSAYVSTLERSATHPITGNNYRPEREVVTALANAVGGNTDVALAFFGYAPDGPLQARDVSIYTPPNWNVDDLAQPVTKADLLYVLKVLSAIGQKLND